MHITGIIAEYNPLHKGHEFHIAKTKSMTNADYVITVLSGDFAQRGIPTITDKHTRAKMALEAGSDLVIELPAYYALSSGEGFGFGSISILHQLGCVNTVSFGTETGDLEILTKIAKELVNETPAYQDAYQTALKQGMTHPAARVYALNKAYPELDTSILDGTSNNMLAIEYCKALYRLNSAITPVTVKREGQAYLEKADYNADLDTFTSATAIRSALEKNPDSNQKFVFLDDFSSILHYKLLALDFDALLTYRDLNESFANKILKHRQNFTTFTEFANLLWTKETTYARVCRILMYILLDFKKDIWDEHTPVPYARILGFKKESAPLLSELKKYASIPLLSKLADAENLLDEQSMKLLDMDIKAAHIYDSIAFQKGNKNGDSTTKPPLHEMQKQIIIL